MNRAVAMSAASALCLILAAGCASTGAQAPKPAEDTLPAKSADLAPGANPDMAALALAKDLPSTLDGEIKRAQLLRKQGNYDEAVHSLAQLMLVAPDNAGVVGEYGKVLEQQGHSRDALAFLKRAVELQPRDWSLHSALGIAYDQLDDHASAKIAYERALALKPGDATVLNNYAVSRMLAGDYADAKRLFARAEAGGVENPKIAGNLEKLAALKPEVPAPSAPSVAMAMPAAPAVPHASAPKTSAAQVAMQQPAPPASVATVHGIASSAAAPRPGNRVAVGAPKALAPLVVMEHVPFDPLAGPVKRPSPAKVVAVADRKAKPAAPKPSEPATPDLRAAADAN